MISRRFILTGLIAGPAIIRTPGLLMPVRPWIEPPAFSSIDFGEPSPDRTVVVMTDAGFESIMVGGKRLREISPGFYMGTYTL